MYGRQPRLPGGVSEEELSCVPITYVDGQHDRFAAPEHFFHL
jgi:hypothetical protein